MADLTKQVKKMALDEEKNIQDKDIFLSPQFHKTLQGFVDAILIKRIKKKASLTIDYNEQPNTPIACTTGTNIYLNSGNRVSNTYTSQTNRFLALLGILFHECAHILYLDFDAEKRIKDDLTDNGNYYGTFDSSDTDTVEEIIEAMQNPTYRPIFVSLYHQLSNTFSDAHDEGKACSEFHGLVERGITLSAEALRSLSDSVETMTKDYAEAPTPEAAVEVMLSLILSFARYGEVVIEDDVKAENNEFIQKLNSLAPDIMRGSTTDSIEEKYTAINACITVLWSYIRDMLSDEQPNNGSDSNSKGNQDRNDNGSQGDQSDSTSDASDTGTGTGSQGSSGNSGGKSDKEKVESVLNAISKAAKKSVPDASQSPTGLSTAKPVPNAQADTKAMSKEEAEKIMNGIISQIKKEEADKRAEDKLEQAMEQDINVIVNAVNMTSPHKGKPVNTHRILTVTQQDIDLYNRQMQDLKVISKSLQRKMLSILKELREGDVIRHRTFGSKLEARDAYRIDSKYFSKKKLPQDVPDMAISVLIDQSASMGGERIAAAQKAAMLLYDFAKGLGIPVMVSGHCAYDGGFHFFRYAEFDSVNDKDRYRLSQISAKSAGNRDGMAMCIALDMLSKRPEEIKLCIVISDGQPADWDYGGEEAKKDMQEIIKQYKHKGIQTFATAIGDDRNRIREIYKDGYLDITDLNTFPKALVKIVKKRIV